jgi:two-component system response regulator AtoC
VVVVSGDEIRTFDLPSAGEVAIGRDEGSAICIDDPSVSRRHAVLRVGDTLEIEDLGGSNGTFVRRTAHAGSGDQTVDVSVRHLQRGKATLKVGDGLLFGTASVVVRHAPRLDLPDLVAADKAGADCNPGMILRDPVMRTLYAEAARVARANINVLLLGRDRCRERGPGARSSCAFATRQGALHGRQLRGAG